MSVILDASGAVTPTRVAICVPAQEQVKTMFAYDLARLTSQTAFNRPDILPTLLFSKGTILSRQRQDLVDAAKEAGASHILWLDSDMRFPGNALVRLLEHNEPIVATNYPTRVFPIIPASAKDGARLFTEEDSSGLVEVQWCGMGCMLTAVDVFAKLPDPWFALAWSEKDRAFNGEDVYFCALARHHGFKVLVDQALSREIAHVGEMEYTHAHALELRDVLREQAQNGS